MKKIITSLLLIVFSAAILTNCKKDKGDPPVLPPQESMVIDFSNFTVDTKSAIVTDQKGTNNGNFVFAATVAGFWRIVIATTLAIPVVTFKHAIDQNPVYLDDKTWQWSYSTTIGSIEYKAKLKGQIRSSDVLWKMYITKSGDNGFNDFLWFEGTSRHDGTSGQWTLYESNASPVALLKIDWAKSGTSIATIKYTLVKNDAYKDSYIEYGTSTGTYDSFYTIHYYNGTKFSDVNVKWNKSTHNGTVQSADFLGDNLWYCWDTNKVNTTCP